MAEIKKKALLLVTCQELMAPRSGDIKFLGAGPTALQIRGRIANAVTHPFVYIGVYRPTDALNETPSDTQLPGAGTFVSPVVGTNRFVHTVNLTSVGPYKVRAWASMTNSAAGYGWCGSVSAADIEAVRMETVPVSATASLWYHNTAAGVAPEAGFWEVVEDPADHQPVAVTIPAAELAEAGILSAVVTSVGNWTHGDPASCSSSPDGRAGVTGPARPGYSANFSGTIQELSGGEDRLGRLVGMFAPAPGNAFTELALGMPAGAAAQHDVPAGADRLLLANHDIFEWNNNGGDLQVTVQWKRRFV